MHKIFTLIISLFFFGKLNAQIITEDVHFDFYQSASFNDFQNYFNGFTTITQIQNNGITGGCLLLQDSIDWGNDRGIYCSTFNPQNGDTSVTGISFKYDTSGINTNSFQRATTIFIHPSADPNHYIIATVSGTKKLELITYGWVNTPYPSLNLLHNHWYRYVLTFASNTNTFQVYIKAEVFNLGLNGTSSPVLLNLSSHTVTDNILAIDTSINVAISGAKYGGAIYLDDFRFKGRKGFSNCITTGVPEELSLKNVITFPSPAQNTLYIEGIESKNEVTISVLNLLGEIVMKIKTTAKNKTALNIAPLASGLYFLRMEEGEQIALKLFLKE